MNVNFKPLGLAAAVAAVTAGYSGVTSAAATYTSAGLGDLAIVPYYTTVGDYVTGVHIINTSESTQVVKLRFRRGSDSMDAMDINLVLSPKDEWTGYVDDSSGKVVLATDDNSCTVPQAVNGDGRFEMPGLYAEGATEGYIEVIGMGQTIDEDQPIALAAVHEDGVPVNCGLVASNFFRNATGFAAPDLTKKGVIDSETTHQTCTDDIAWASGALPLTQSCAGDALKDIAPTPVIPNDFESTDNVLKVSFFVRDGNGGLEFGGNAVNLSDFSDDAMMTNQQKIIVGEDDLYSFLFPDLDGGSPADTTRGLYEDIRAELGVTAVINDWSVASARNVSTDWVVTLPGQYLMVDLNQYTASLLAPDEEVCLSLEAAAKYNATIPAPAVPAEQCDARDIPVLVLDSSETYDREEGFPTFTSPEDGLVISPEVDVLPPEAITVLEYEVNVLEWVAESDSDANPVLTSQYAKTIDVTAWEAEYGWASLSVASDSLKTQGIFNFAASVDGPVFDSVDSNVPMVGFVAWERSFPSNPGANYGRLIEHSYLNSAE